MNILLHTIALEPARWTPARVSRPLIELLPSIARAGFNELEIYEPHLESPNEWPSIKDTLAQHDLTAVILSSYLKLDPAEASDGTLAAQLEAMAERIGFFGFQKVRLFPAKDPGSTDAFGERLHLIAARLPEIELLLETHDGSLADQPALLTKIVTDLALPNVGLLYQPTIFEAAAALEQFRIQQPLIRHFHLQNRRSDLTFANLEAGVIPWHQIITSRPPDVDATLEFVPSGICPHEQFNLQATLREAVAEADYIRQITAAPTR